MLNIFPIQFLAPLAYALLRLCVGFLFLYFGKTHLRNRTTLRDMLRQNGVPFSSFFIWYVVVVEMVVGVLFVLGLYTQIAALLAMLFVLKLHVMRRQLSHPLLLSGTLRFLLFFCALSLFITGAGAFAFDLPI